MTPETQPRPNPHHARRPCSDAGDPAAKKTSNAPGGVAVFQDGCKIKQPGKIAGDADNDMAWQRVCCEQNPEIDRRMARLLDPGHRCYSPVLWRLLDAFYRRGLCDEARGWQVAARASGLPNFRWRDGRNRRHFDKLIDIAVEQLWLAATDVPRKP